ncbi:MAG: flagellar M-ring protein FliF C-terminal domain-containing protein [Pseudomonadota bacterium]|nr:flagellar M-ring protein FliF C-terminal domain-containing protein [Pseudomonadota bacterium]
MSGRFSLSPVWTILLTALITVGLGLYIAPRLGEMLALEKIQWGIASTPCPQAKSPFIEHNNLQTRYEAALKQDIITTLEKIAGSGTIHAIVRAPLDLVWETKTESHTGYSHKIGNRVHRLSVTVLVDGTSIPDNRKKSVYHPRSKAELKRYTDIVKSIIGYNVYRGDKVKVQNAPFIPPKGSWGGIPRNIWANGIAFLLLTGLIIGIIVGFLFPLMQLSLTALRGKCSSHSYPLIKRVMMLCQKYPDQSLSVIKGWLNAPQLRKNSRTYTPAERAGILVLALGKKISVNILHPLSPKETRDLTQIISRLGALSASDVQDALARFMRDFFAPDYLKGTPKTAQDLFPNISQDDSEKKLWSTVCAMPDENIKILLEYTDKDVLAMALATENIHIHQIFARNMPPSIWRELEKSFRFLGKKSADAQQIIIKTAQELNLIG